MATVTLDFTASYRAITDADLTLPTVRDTIGFGGNGVPIPAITFTSPSGNVTLPGYDYYADETAYVRSHSPFADHLDLIDVTLPNQPYLRFQVAINVPPRAVDYVPATWSLAAAQQYYTQLNVFYTALSAWENYVDTASFMVSTGSYSDGGGFLAVLTSASPTLPEDIATSFHFFSNCTVIGSNFDDAFGASAFGSNLYGGGGDDTLSGQLADDFLSGGLGADILAGGPGLDDIFGGVGDDTMDGGDGDDAIFGGAGIDSIEGRLGNDSLYGGSGADTLFGDAGLDVMSGGFDDDTMVGGDGSDLMRGDSGFDGMFGGLGNDSLFGGSDSDHLDGADGNDSLRGGDDSDDIFGGAGADTLRGDAGNDLLYAGSGNDVVRGDAGNDSTYAGSGNDIVRGDVGDDFLRGEAGKDTLTGGGGKDGFIFKHLGTANADLIVDFVRGPDWIGLEASAFAAVGPTLGLQEFRLGTAALDGNDRILYNAATGRLYYDPDGTLNGAQGAAAVLFAIVANHAALSHLDFLVV